MFRLKFFVFSIFRNIPLERGFNSKTIHDAKFFKKYNSRCAHFRGLKLELAGKISEHWSLLRKKLWDNTHSKVIFMMYLVIRPINENVLLFWMTMHINNSLDATLVLRKIFWELISDSFYHVFDCENLTMQLLVRPFILTIQITAWKRWTIIPTNSSVWINKRDYLKNKFLSQLLCIRMIAGDKFEESMHHKWWIGFTWVHPCK